MIARFVAWLNRPPVIDGPHLVVRVLVTVAVAMVLVLIITTQIEPSGAMDLLAS